MASRSKKSLRRNIVEWLITFAVAGVLLSFLAPASWWQFGVTEVDARRQGEDFSLKAIDGDVWKFAEHRNEVVLVNYWASWCGPCRIEVPGLVRLANEYAGRGVSVVGVSVDEDIGLIPPFIEKYQIKYPILVMGFDPNLPADGFALPTTFTWKFIREFEAGNAIFTQPNTPIKCGGAPQKIAYLAEDYFRIHGMRDNATVKFITATPTIFTSPHYAPTLTQHCKDKGIETIFKHNLVAIRAESKEAVFSNVDTGEELVEKYELLHVTPPMSAPDFIKESVLASELGWVEVDKETLRHTRFENIFALGDSSNLPTSKTGAAIRKQAPVVAENLRHAAKGEPLSAKYSGYTSCPLVTGYDSLIMAEFGYDLKPDETFPFDQNKERYSMYLVKRYLLPQLYWHGMLRGRA